jgi:c-di-GMP-binding flagellar brake protein YcgR
MQKVAEMSELQGEVAPEQRRKHPRFMEPIDGCVLGIMDVPLQLYNLSAGGCFVTSAGVCPAPGRVFDLRIDLPHHGSIEVVAETRYVMPEYGCGVQFVEMSADARERLEQALARIARGQSGRRG